MNNTQPLLSTLIIVKNAEKTIAACLQSIKAISNEIIILDSGSTDATVSICQRYTSQIFVTDWPGYGVQRQRALAKARGTWVLFIDADEILSPACAQAIKKVIKQVEYNGYCITINQIFANKTIKGSGRIRLFKRQHAEFNAHFIHEGLTVTGKIGLIHPPILHYSYRSIGHWVSKMNDYTELAVAAKKKKGKTGSVRRAIFAGMYTFIKCYFLRKEFLSGRYGLVTAINAAIYDYIKYTKLALDDSFTLPKPPVQDPQTDI